MNEELKNILSRVDHTLLAQGATWNEIKAICDDGIKYGCASVCIPASYVKRERRQDGSLYRMTPAQRKQANALDRKSVV